MAALVTWAMSVLVAELSSTMQVQLRHGVVTSKQLLQRGTLADLTQELVMHGVQQLTFQNRQR